MEAGSMKSRRSGDHPGGSKGTSINAAVEKARAA
jgi:hypothetical protein